MPIIETKAAASSQGYGEFTKKPIPATYIEDVFSTYLYTGNGTSQTITNGIDLSGKGGLVWQKSRQDIGWWHILFDTVTGINKNLSTNVSNAQTTVSGNSVLSNGFVTGTNNGYTNENNYSFASWTFRKQPKFFDVVTYTGNGVAGKTVAHNLGSTPGCIIIKSTSLTETWYVYHRSLGVTKYLTLNQSDAATTTVYGAWNLTSPTSSVFTVGDDPGVNSNGQTYVAYLFAHDAGGFGATGTDNVISCGSFTTDGSGNATVNLGYEPQWVLAKRTNGIQDWKIIDVMRGFVATSSGDSVLYPNLSNAEGTGSDWGKPTATGFTVDSQPSSATFVYIAIRRPMKTPTTGTSVFAPVLGTGGTTGIPTSFTVDSSWVGYKPGGFTRFAEVTARLIGPYYMGTSSANNESYNASIEYAKQTGFGSSYYTSDMIGWEFQRAPGFFDVVCYTGTGSYPFTINHNLGVAPELMIFKQRNAVDGWYVYAQPNISPNANWYQNYLQLNLDTATASDTSSITTAPTSTQINIASYYAASSAQWILYLFATCAGVSKVGSYTGNGSSQTINCGFTAGARFVMIKRTNSTGNWFVWDTARGMVAGNDPYLALNLTSAEVTSNDSVDTDNSGFIVNQLTATNINVSSATYIYLAIA